MLLGYIYIYRERERERERVSSKQKMHDKEGQEYLWEKIHKLTNKTRK